jgi:hypothetical protein
MSFLNKQEEGMFFKQGFRNALKIFLILSLLSPVFAAQLKLLCKFNGLQIPYNLKFGGKVLEKGTYNLEAVKDKTAPRYFLRIKKGNKVLCLIQGEQLKYADRSWYMRIDPTIPDKCTLKMNRNIEEKVVYIMIETGKKNRMGPYQKLRFKIEYEE